MEAAAVSAARFDIRRLPVSDWWRRIRQSLWRANVPPALLALTGIGASLRCAFIRQPMRYDEAYTYLTFVRGNIAAAFYYPVPNNHVLHTLLVRASVLVFGHQVVAIRLPSLLAGVLVIPATFALARLLHRDAASGYVAAAMVAVTPYLVLYDTMARGYSLLTLLSLLLAMCAWNLAAHPTLGRCGLAVAVTSLGLLDIPNAVVVASIGLAALGTAGLLGSSRARAGLLVPALLAGGAAVLTARHAIPFPRTWIYLLPFVALVVDAGAVAAVRWIRVPAWAAGIVLATGLALLALRRESVLAYADTGRFVEAPIVVDALSREMSRGDSIVADVPADAPVQFYMLQQGVPRSAMRGRAGQAARTFYIVKPADYSLGSLTSAHSRLLLAVGDAQLYVSDDTSRRRLP